MCVFVQFIVHACCRCFFFQAEDGIRYLVRSRGLGDVYKRQGGNSSVVHVDFMIGSAEIDVDGLSDDGAVEPLMLSLIHI